MQEADKQILQMINQDLKNKGIQENKLKGENVYYYYT